MRVRPTNNPDEHIELAKRAYVEGSIEADELERRVALALEGPVEAPGVPLYDAWETETVLM